MHLISKMVRKIFIMLVGASLCAACSMSDANMSDLGSTHIWDFGIVEPTHKDQNGEYIILRDDGVDLDVVANQWPNYKPVVGERVYFNYEALSQGSNLDKLEVKMYHISAVELLRPRMQSEVTQTEAIVMGKDPIRNVASLSFSGKYVNLEYEYPRERTESKDDGHRIGMAVDDVTAADGKVTVRLKHNANGDTPSAKPDATFTTNNRSAMVSFDMAETVEKFGVGGVVELTIEWSAYTNDKWEETKVEKITKRFDPSAWSMVVVRGGGE